MSSRVHGLRVDELCVHDDFLSYDFLSYGAMRYNFRNYMPPVTSHVSRAACLMSHVNCHVWHVTCHMCAPDSATRCGGFAGGARRRDGRCGGVASRARRGGRGGFPGGAQPK